MNLSKDESSIINALPAGVKRFNSQVLILRKSVLWVLKLAAENFCQWLYTKYSIDLWSYCQSSFNPIHRILGLYNQNM